jgi:hypothetical protein
MNPIVLQLANGNLFFIGLVMIVAALFLRLWFEGRILGLVLRISYIAGVVFVIFSATPLLSGFIVCGLVFAWQPRWLFSARSFLFKERC